MTIKLTETILPWYRYRGPWLLMLGPFVVVVAGVATAYLAFSSNDGLVDDDYYKQGLAVNQVTAREQNATSLGLQAEVMQAADGGALRVLLRGAPTTALPESLLLRITHPTRAGVDRSVELKSEGGGIYAGRLDAALAGRWHVSLEDGARSWRLTGDWLPEKSPVLQLSATRAR